MILIILSYAVVIFFTATVLYTIIFSIAGLFYKKVVYPAAGKYINIAILIPAYKEDEVIISVSEHMQKLNYPSANYQVFVIADQLKDETLQQLEAIGVTVVPVAFETSTKAKSLNYCLDQIKEEDYDLVLISDADNILSKDFLTKINDAYLAGNKIIQGRRVAKNSDSSYAVLDGASEIINNHIFRKGPNAFNLSASLIGSGMGFSTGEIKEALNEIKAIGGFDKVLQLNVIAGGNKILYLEDAVIYDEKISDSGNFKNQRKRWLASQYIYLAKFFPSALKALFKGNFDYFNIAFLHNFFLPRVINLGLLFVLSVLALLLDIDTVFNFVNMILLFSLYLVALLIALPKRFYNKKLFLALLALPGAFLNMFLLLFRLKGADKTFIHTKHSKKDIDNTFFSVDDKK